MSAAEKNYTTNNTVRTPHQPPINPEHPCEICGTPTTNAKYCNRKCRTVGRKTPHPCPECGRPTKNASTCSTQCSEQIRLQLLPDGELA